MGRAGQYLPCDLHLEPFRQFGHRLLTFQHFQNPRLTTCPVFGDHLNPHTTEAAAGGRNGGKQNRREGRGVGSWMREVRDDAATAW